MVYLLTNLNKKNLILTLSTGHGKSVIIQLLADILSHLEGKVIIVCVNNFLAHWGRTVYGSFNVKAEKIDYMPLEHFIKRTPDKNTHVIFDEIDQMLGSKSFSMIEEGSDVTAIY